MAMLNIGNLGPGWQENEHLVQKLGWQMVNLPMEVRNAGLNHALFEAGNNPTSIPRTVAILERLFNKPGRVQSMENCPRGEGPLLIIGSGSSLDPIMPKIKEWPGKIICSTSHASTLAYYGRHADYIVCMDPRTATIDNELDMPDFGHSALIAHPSIPHEYVMRWMERCDGPIYLSRIMEPTYEWYSHHLGQQYPWVNHVILPMIDSGAAMVSFGAWLGYNPVYLIGLDYGGPRFQRWDYDMATKQWKPDIATSGYVAKGGNFSGLTAEGVMAYSSRGTLMSSYMQMANQRYKLRIYNLSDVSVLTQFPKAEWDEAVSGREPVKVYPFQRTLDEIDIALSVWDTFLVPSESGWGTDHHTYITPDEPSMVYSILVHNRQIAANITEFDNIEKQFGGKRLLDLIRANMVSIEAGDLLIRGSDEMGDWDWRTMKPIDMGPVLSLFTDRLMEGPQVVIPAIAKAIADIDAMGESEVVTARLLGPVLARRRYLIREAKKRGLSKPKRGDHRAILTQKMADDLREYVKKTPQDEHAALKLAAIEQGLQKVGEPLPPNGLYPMPAHEVDPMAQPRAAGLGPREDT